MEPITKDDLRQSQMQLLNEIEKLLDEKIKPASNDYKPEWIRTKAARTFMSMSPATIQSLRISGKVRFKKVLGAYYYYFPDLKNLFEGGKK